MSRSGRARRRKQKRRTGRRKQTKKALAAFRHAQIRRAIMPLGEHGVGFDPKDGKMKLWKGSRTGVTYADLHNYVGVEVGWFVVNMVPDSFDVHWSRPIKVGYP